MCDGNSNWFLSRNTNFSHCRLFKRLHDLFESFVKGVTHYARLSAKLCETFKDSHVKFFPEPNYVKLWVDWFKGLQQQTRFYFCLLTILILSIGQEYH